MGAATDIALPRVKVAEGFRPYPYHDTTGHLTTGYGFNLDVAIPERLATVICQWQLDEVEYSIGSFAWFQACDPTRQSVLVEMAFNMGEAGLFGFRQMLAACLNKDWQTVHDQMLSSAWATQVGQRAQNLARIMLTGEP